MSSSKKKTGGNPAHADPAIKRLYDAMMSNIDMCTKAPRDTPYEIYLNMRVAALASMWAYSRATNTPPPDTIAGYGE